MKVKHSCGHEVDVPPCNAWHIRKTFCFECQELARLLQEEQSQVFNEAIEENTNGH